MSETNYSLGTDRTVSHSGSEARVALRAWVTERGVRSSYAVGMTMSALNSCWLDTSDAELNRHVALSNNAPARPASKPEPSQPDISLTDAQTILDIFKRAKGGAAELDEARVVELIQEHAPRPEPYVAGYKFETSKSVFEVKSRQHAFFPLVVASLSVRQHVWLVGPAGGGKTTMVAAAAAAIGLQYRGLSVCAQTTKTDLLGFIDAHGVYRSTAFREAFEQGLVFVLDEVDAGNANTLAVLNSALANGEMTFPDATVKRHENFVVVACANTFGGGATAQYIGRNALDPATLDRFFFVQLPYDEGLEASFIGIEGVPSPAFNLSEGGKVETADWFRLVQTARQNADKNAIKAVISPRATIAGAKLAALGVGKAWLVKGLIVKSLDAISAGKLNLN
jgi:hypothetical protein